MRQWLKCALGPAAAVGLVVVVLVLSRDVILRLAIEQQVQSRTGFGLSLGKVRTRLTTPSFSLNGVCLRYPDEMGGETLLNVPRLEVEYDPRLALSGRIRVRQLDVDVEELTLVRTSSGTTLTESILERLAREPAQPKPPAASRPVKTASRPATAVFDGVDRLVYSLGVIHYVDQQQPRNNWQRVLNWKGREQRDLRTSQDALNWLASTFLEVIQVPPAVRSRPAGRDPGTTASGGG